jgi:hypothetical protein
VKVERCRELLHLHGVDVGRCIEERGGRRVEAWIEDSGEYRLVRRFHDHRHHPRGWVVARDAEQVQGAPLAVLRWADEPLITRDAKRIEVGEDVLHVGEPREVRGPEDPLLDLPLRKAVE